MGRFLRWFFGIIFGIVISMIGAYYLAKKYEPPIRDYIVNEVNKRLHSPVHVSDINFSFLERFPSASLVMDSVWAEENVIKIGEADTLFFFRKVYLNLNLFEIFGGQYEIKEIETRDGFLRLSVDETGHDNFHIWVKSQDTTGFLLELDKVHIEQTEFSYINKLRRQDYHLLAEDIYFNGRFSDESYTMDVSGEGRVHDLRVKGTSYLKNRDVWVNTDLDIISSAERYAFRLGRVVIDDVLHFGLSGLVEGQGVDLRVVGKNLDIVKSLSLIPFETRKAFEAYRSSGVFNLEMELEGAFGKTENPSLRASFSFENATISKKGSDIVLSRLSGEGSIDNGASRSFKSSTLLISDLTGELNGDPVATTFSIRDFNKPTIDGTVDLKTSIHSLREFLNIQWMAEGEGAIDVQANISTSLANFSDSEAKDFLNAEASGSIIIRDAAFRLKEDDRAYQIDSAYLTIVNNALAIESYEGRINEARLSLRGKADGFLDYFFNEEGTIQVKGKMSVDTLNMDEMFPSRNDDSAHESNVVVVFPPRASWELNLQADQFQASSFIANDVSGILVMNAFKVEATNLTFNSQNGSIAGKVGIYRFDDNQFGWRTDFKLEGIDAKMLFKTFSNFEQSFITSEVLNGTLSADVQFQSFCDSLFHIDRESIVASADLTIMEGSLSGFSPLIQIADEIKKKKVLKLIVAEDELRKRLQDVVFDTLRNEISISRGVIHIPEMKVRSSAIDLNVSGSHSFNNEIEYEIDFALSEILSLNERKESYNEFVRRDQKGRTRIYMLMTGTVDEYEVIVQRSDIQASMKEEIKSEALEIKGLLNEEFGVFEGDSIIRIDEPKQELEIEFDPEGDTSSNNDSSRTSDPTDSPEQKKKKGLLDKIIKKTETDKKKLKEGDFEDDDF